ncbi:MAG: hypothetical protein U5O69_08910 [Candidatus Competibacteraceae bacterium]|nr:hypothetical protein [Candidatus Competibacteraceae bacterium]
MAHFFQPTQPDRARVDVAVSEAALSELFIRPGAAVRVGLWGWRASAGRRCGCLSGSCLGLA